MFIGNGYHFCVDVNHRSSIDLRAFVQMDRNVLKLGYMHIARIRYVV